MATICGTGTITSPNVTIPTLCGNGGIIINPGNSPGILAINGDFNNEGAILQIEIDGTTVGTTYDQLQVTGDMDIGADAKLELQFGFLPDPTDVFNIVLANSITGTFDPANITISGITFNSYNISYPGGNTIQLTIDALTLLPVEWVHFKGEAQAEGIELHWQTANEQNNQGFRVQRSQNGRSWEDLAFVRGKGNSQEKTTYQWIDETPLSGTNYYRLEQVDLDGSISYSDVISIAWRSNPTQESIVIAPNPVKNQLTLINVSPEKLNMELFDLTGRQVTDFQLQESEKAEFSLAHLQAGVYLLKIHTTSGVQVKRLVKQ